MASTARWKSEPQERGRPARPLRSRRPRPQEGRNFRRAVLGFRHQRALALGTAAACLVHGLERAGERLVDLETGFDLVLYRALARHVYRQYPGLQTAVHFGLTRARTEFQSLDRKFLELERQRISWLLYRNPVTAGVGTGRPSDFTERALLHHEAGKKGRHLPLRDLFARAMTAARQLKPCFMMSPVTAAQYLPRAINLFDLVVIDEASQVWPEDVFSSLVRAGSSSIVGDPKQLPPTSFFRGLSGSIGQEDGSEETDAPIDLDESVLDQAVRTFKPIRHLRWHYRSQNSRLIQFSNHYFYDNRLVVFPGPHEHNGDTGVRLFRTNGSYRSSCNPEEARIVVEAARAFMRTKRGLSLGIVTLNSTQRDLLLEEFDRVAVGDSEVKRYIDTWEPSLNPFFIKNIENVQGDERDVMFISTVVGRAAGSDRFSLTSLGAINQQNGPRRLNVLFTRARRQVCVFSSLEPGDIPSTAREGAKILRSYLEYAAQAPLAATFEPRAETESAFERLVKLRLESEGYEVVAQVGAGGYRIDLGIRHVAYPYGFLLGVECDGQHYHSGRTVRDRDRLRQMVLETLGWRLYRIWSADWFADPDREMALLLDVLERRIDELRTELGVGVPIAVEDPRSDRYGTQGMESGAPRPPEAEDLFGRAEPGLPSTERPVFLLSPPAPEMPTGNDGSGAGDPPDAMCELSLAPDSFSAGTLPPPSDAFVDPSRIVEIGDVVFYEEIARPGFRQQVRIVDGPDQPDQRIIHYSKPLAVGLLNAAIGERVQVKFPNRNVELLVIGLDKASAGQSRSTGAGQPPSPPNGAPYPYTVWATDVGLPDPTRARVEAVADSLLRIIEVEGPAAVSRIYRCYMRSAGYSRLSQAMASALNKALFALERREEVIVVTPRGATGYAEGVVRLAGGPAVRLREIMPRDLTEVPIDELAAHLRRLSQQIPDGGREEVYRECLRLAGAVRLTQQLRGLFDRAWELTGE